MYVCTLNSKVYFENIFFFIKKQRKLFISKIKIYFGFLSPTFTHPRLSKLRSYERQVTKEEFQVYI